VAAIQRLTAAYLRDVLYDGDGIWKAATDELHAIGSIGQIDSR
jgi:hypothetical protein